MKQIIQGGFGFVYLVEDELGNLRALKHMLLQSKKAMESAKAEIKLMVF